ncbi:hypothetical protein [Hyphomicrobium sp. LHD-15]|uniref:hypothetical protein n=1 Tax=Hyphomicrobium sp. LHD-15 TaxID=3072142 RepID=UPI00280C634C|nr:hypothetical protein [Hyphomicrobium sp. LHD-15]MDQ8697547.1 hypothetical protein [Hyphomicrobium sp. LHD-15]
MGVSRASSGSGAFCAALLAIVSLFPAPATAGGSDPQIVLDEIYGQVAEMCGGDGQGAAYDIEAIAKSYFTPALAKKISSGLASGDLDYDVLVDGNDCKVTDLDLTIVGGGSTMAIARASFKNLGEDRVVDLQMVKSGSDWQVADIVYRHRAFSLKSAF